MLVINGGDGSYYFGVMQRKILKSLNMKEFGDCVGICLHYQDADEIASEMAETELQKSPSKNKKKD